MKTIIINLNLIILLLVSIHSTHGSEYKLFPKKSFINMTWDEYKITKQKNDESFFTNPSFLRNSFVFEVNFKGFSCPSGKHA